jgi:hypothetical protein
MWFIWRCDLIHYYYYYYYYLVCNEKHCVNHRSSIILKTKKKNGIKISQFNVNFNANFNLFLRLSNCASVGGNKLDVHGSVHRNKSLIGRANKMQPCSIIYYSSVS